MASNPSISHWVEELFPPKYKLSSSFDSDKAKLERIYSIKVRNIPKIYEDVYLSAVSPHNGLDPTLESFENKKVKKPEESPEKTANNDIEKDNVKRLRSESTDTRPGDVVAEGKCIWSAEELTVLRNSLKRSRLNNIRLSVLTRSLQEDCEHLRNICHEQAQEILVWNKKYNDVRKQSKRMKIVCKAFKEDARTYSSDLERCQGLLEDALVDKRKSELELLQTKKELEYTQKQCEKLNLELEKQKALQDRLLNNQKNAFELIKAREVYELTAKLEQTALELEKEKNDHSLNRKALEHLRLHFTSGRA